MASAPLPLPDHAAPPWETLRVRLLERADALASSGEVAAGASLRATVDAWWEEQQEWNRSFSRVLRIHHEINNALVGVSGNVQLLLMGPTGQHPAYRERLQVVLRESGRIEEAARRLRAVRLLFDPRDFELEPPRAGSFPT